MGTINKSTLKLGQKITIDCPQAPEYHEQEGTIVDFYYKLGQLQPERFPNGNLRKTRRKSKIRAGYWVNFGQGGWRKVPIQNVGSVVE